MKPIAPPFEEQVKALFDQFPWEKAERVLRVLSKKVDKHQSMAVYYNVDQLKVTAAGMLRTLHKEPFEISCISTGHILVRRDEGYYGIQLDLHLDASTEDTDFFMDGKYRDEFRTAYHKLTSKPRWREPVKHFIERTKRNS